MRDLRRAAIGRNKLVRLALLLIGLQLLAMAVPMGLRQIARVMDPSVAVLLLNAVVVAVFVAGYVGLVRVIEQRPANELSPPQAPGELAIGALTGILLFATVIGVLWSLGFATITSSPRDFARATIAISVVSGVTEELIFRGALFRVLEASFGTLAALAVSAFIFGAVHSFNPGATLLTSSFVAVEAGVLLGLAYSVCGRLWLPIGLHFGWNFAESGIFGSSLSGYSFGGLLHTVTSGPPLLSGGSFGPEGSVVAMAVCVAASTVLAIITMRRGNWRPATVQLQAT